MNETVLNLVNAIKSGDAIQNVIQNNKFWESFFSSNTNLDKVYYYFTIGQKGVINNRVDTITEALRFDRNILNFNVEMLGGWDEIGRAHV